MRVPPKLMGVSRRGERQAGTSDTELDKLQRIPLLVVDEVGYIPFERQTISAQPSDVHDSAAQMSVAVPLVETSVKTPSTLTVNTTRPT